MRTGWIAVVVLAGCGALPPPEQLPGMRAKARPEVAAAPVPDVVAMPTWQSADELRQLWWSFGITGDNYQTRVLALPQDYREELASVLLRDGGFSCETIVTEDGCGVVRRLATPASYEGIDDPCLRRYLALWALDQIQTGDQAAAVYGALIQLVRTPAPDVELPEQAFQKLALMGEASTALWEASDAGNRDLVERHLDALDDADLLHAAKEHDIDLAARKLVATANAGDEILTFTASNTEFPTETRLAAIQRLTEIAVTEDELDALRRITRTADCSVAGAAAGALAGKGERAFLDRGPFASKDDLLHATCQTLGAAGESGTAWRRVLTPHAMTVTNHLDDPLYVDTLWTKYPFAVDRDDDGAPDVPEADADRDGVPSTRVEVKLVKPGNHRRIPFADELRLALPHCDDELDCAVPGTSVHFQLDVRKERGTKYRLHAVDRFEHVGFDC